MRRSPRRMLWGAAGAGLLATLSGTVGPIARADGPAPSPSGPSSNRAAQAPGTWTIAVVTSATEPASKALLQSLRSTPWVIANADRVKLGEVSSDVPGRPSAGGSTAVLVYQQGPRGLEMMGGRSGFTGADDVIQWVRTVVANSAESSIHDPNLTQANLFGKSQPTASAQWEAPSMPTAQAQPPMASVPSVPPPQMTTTYAVPMMASTANVVQAPQQHLVIQQAPTQVLFAPQGAPMVYVPQAAASAPAGNLFMPTASMPAPTASVAAPMMAMTAPAAMPVASVAPSQPVASVGSVPTGPMVAGAALTTSSVSVPASSTSSRVRVRGPGPMASALSRLGEKMTTLGRTRIETVQETRLETQTSQTPPGQYVTLSSTSASPVMSQPQAGVSAPSAPAPQQCLPPLPPNTQASPQSQGSHWRWH